MVARLGEVVVLSVEVTHWLMLIKVAEALAVRLRVVILM
jgi:hypothetical protein